MEEILFASKLIEQCIRKSEIEVYNKSIETINKDPQAYGLVAAEEGLLSIPTYFYISKLIPKDSVIVDCGCCVGYQQILFNHHRKYIGIDIQNNFQYICSNAEFIHGDILDILPNLELPRKYSAYGISVLCGMCDKRIVDAMNKKFTYVISL